MCVCAYGLLAWIGSVTLCQQREPVAHLRFLSFHEREKLELILTVVVTECTVTVLVYLFN